MSKAKNEDKQGALKEIKVCAVLPAPREQREQKTGTIRALKKLKRRGGYGLKVSALLHIKV